MNAYLQKSKDPVQRLRVCGSELLERYRVYGLRLQGTGFLRRRLRAREWGVLRKPKPPKTVALNSQPETLKPNAPSLTF